MSGSAPPPLPPEAPSSAGFQGSAETMKSRWIAWVLASVVGPALPWVFMYIDDQGTAFMMLIGVALVLQLIASIRVALGLARIRGHGAGGVFGFSILFMFASVAIGSAVFFVACFGALSMQ